MSSRKTGVSHPLLTSYRPYWVYLPHISGRTNRNPEMSLLWRAHIKALPMYPPPLGGLYLHSPSRIPRQVTASVLVSIVVEAPETE